MTERVASEAEAVATEHDPFAELPPALAHNPLWEDTPHRPGDPPLRRQPPEFAANTPGGRLARVMGREFRAWREARGLTQRAVGERLGWAQPAVARLEGGAVGPTAATLALLLERLGVRITFGQGAEGPIVVVETARGAA